MFLDKENQLSEAQVVTTTALSQDVYNFQKTGGDHSIGCLFAGYIVPRIDAAGAATYTLEVVQSDDATFATGVTVVASKVVLGAAFKKDIPVIVPIAQGSFSKQYAAIRYSVAGGTAPTVTLDGHIVPQYEIPVNPFFKKVQETI